LVCNLLLLEITWLLKIRIESEGKM
jgi:hypothetical protein